MAFLGKHLLGKTGETLTSTLNFTSPLLIYFSASWCPPCRAFSPKLISFYNKQKEMKNNIEVVLVGLDETEKAHQEYFDKMPWLSIPFNEKALVEELMRKYSVQSIPTLIQVNKLGEVVENDCRFKVESTPNEAYGVFVKRLLEKRS